jgi:NADH-quinone oxidoreductase subunit H
MVEQLFYFLIFPGMLFAGIIGGFISWADRKITARLQFRQGPPLLQPFYDFLKLLLVKETVVPEKGSPILFLLAPVLGLFGASASALLVLLPAFGIANGFRGDIIVLFYLLTIPSLMFVFGAMASGNPLSAVGASREIKLILSYELSFILLVAVVILKSGLTLHLDQIMAVQQSQGAFIGSLSGIMLFVAALFVIQGKAGLIPFDLAEAETEIAEGVFMEYSGTAYAIIKFTKYIMLFVLPVFVSEMFLGGISFSGIHILWSVLKILLVIVLMVLIRNTNPRVKISQAMHFFLLWINLIVIAATVLHFLGL